MDPVATGDLWESKLQELVHVDVQYYDDAHREALQGYPDAIGIDKVVAHPLYVPVDEFLTYFLFHRARTGSKRLAGYAQVRRMVTAACAALQYVLKLKTGVLTLEEDVRRIPRELTEHVGESVALSVVNRIHDLIEADWLPIEEGPKGRTFDFECGSNGAKIIQVEAKGCVVDDNSVKSAAVSNQKADIEAKKASLAKHREDVLRYGVITAISKLGQPLRSWLLDPTPDDPPKSPADFQLLARLHFLRWVVWLISPRSHLATALATRINTIREQSEPYRLSGVSLLQADGKPFSFDRIHVGADSFSAFFATRSRVTGGAAGGVVIPMEAGDALLFVGMREQLVDLAIGQSFHEITSYRAERAIIRKSVDCVVPKGEFRRMDLREEELPEFTDGGSYVHFSLTGTLAYTCDGLIFGALPVPGREVRSPRIQSF